jgi:hypothetical protein
MSTNCNCGAPAPDSWLCRTCDAALEKLLSELPALVDDLQAYIGRMLRFSSGRIGGRSAEIQLLLRVDRNYPVSRASSLADNLRNLLVGIIRDLIESRGLAARHLPPDDLARMAAWVGARSSSVRMCEDAWQTLTDLQRLSASIRGVVDHPPEWKYAGKCSMLTGDPDKPQECSQELYAVDGATFIRCRTCGYQHDVENRYSVLQAASRDILLTIPELKDALPEVLGVPINHATLRKWKERGRIVAHGELNGKDLFRVGDILDLVVDQQQREEAS